MKTAIMEQTIPPLKDPNKFVMDLMSKGFVQKEINGLIYFIL